MNDYIVEDIVVSLTTDEYNKVIEALLCLDNEGYGVPDTLYDKFSQDNQHKPKWWELTETETTDQPQGE